MWPLGVMLQGSEDWRNKNQQESERPGLELLPGSITCSVYDFREVMISSSEKWDSDPPPF